MCDTTLKHDVGNLQTGVGWLWFLVLLLVVDSCVDNKSQRIQELKNEVGELRSQVMRLKDDQAK